MLSEVLRFGKYNVSCDIDAATWSMEASIGLGAV